jgi:hypothetical protein
MATSEIAAVKSLEGSEKSNDAQRGKALTVR